MGRLSVLLLLALSSVAVAQTAPDQVVEDTASALLAALDGRRDELRGDPVALFEIVGNPFPAAFRSCLRGVPRYGQAQS